MLNPNYYVRFLDILDVDEAPLEGTTYPFQYLDAGSFRPRYYLDFNELRPLGEDEHIARLNGVLSGRDELRLRALAWRSNTVDTTSFGAMLCAFVADSSTRADWDVLHLRGGLVRESASTVLARIEWVDAAGNVHALGDTPNIAMAANAFHYITLKVYEEEGSGARRVSLYTSPNGNPDTLTLRVDVAVPAALLVSGHNHVALYTTAADPPGEPFAYGGVSLYDFEVLVLPPPCSVTLTIYDDDRVTPLWEVGTSPGHPYPYLCLPENYSEQQIDIAGGHATIGTVGYAVIDPPLVAGDQDGGWMTAKLARLGLGDILGRRTRMMRFIDDVLGYQVIQDGPAGPPRMDSSYAAFSGNIRDTRETERRIRCFDLFTPLAAISDDVTVPPDDDPGYGFDITWGTLHDAP